MNSTPAATDGARTGAARRPAGLTIASFAALALSSLLVLASLGAVSSADLPGSARLVLVSAVIALLSPLFWPGRAATARATAWRVVNWSLAVALLAVVASLGAGHLRHVATTGALLLLICATTLGIATRLESFLARRGAGAETARGVSAWLATALLAITAATPLWLGPAAELASAGRPRAIQAVVAVSPLVHIAVASGNDLLRNQWFYQHSNLAGLRFDYPRLAPVIWMYAATSFALVFLPVIARFRRPPHFNPSSPQE
jgi:hypothetical protein